MTSNENTRAPEPAEPGEQNLADKVMDRGDDNDATQVRNDDRIAADADRRDAVTADELRGEGWRDQDGSGRNAAQSTSGENTARESTAGDNTAQGTSGQDASDQESTANRPLFREDPSSGSAAGASAATAGGATAGVGAAAAGGAASGADDHTRVQQQPATDPAETRAQQRADRDRALGKVPVSNEPERHTPARPPRTTDKFAGSLGLLIFRWVVGLIMGVHGLQHLLNLEGTRQFFETTALRDLGGQVPYYAALATAIGEIAIALGLLVGFLTRIAGLGTALIGIGALVLVQWLTNPLDLNGTGFAGELELLLTACGILLLLVGAGGWSVDGAMRRSRARKRAR